MAEIREKEQFLAYLRGAGHRVTSERLALFDEIFAQHGHLDAEQLHAAMRSQGLKISRATVYRNLDLLVASGLASKQRLGGAGDRRFLYEHVHRGQRHDHLVCASCGRVVEFVSPGIAALQTEICRAHGFVPTHHTLEIRSLCNDCAAASEVLASARPTVNARGGNAGV